jgi:hypothetical protein
MQMHRQIHLAEWIERVYDLLAAIEDGAGTSEEIRVEAGQSSRDGPTETFSMSGTRSSDHVPDHVPGTSMAVHSLGLNLLILLTYGTASKTQNPVGE